MKPKRQVKGYACLKNNRIMCWYGERFLLVTNKKEAAKHFQNFHRRNSEAGSGRGIEIVQVVITYSPLTKKKKLS